MGNKTCDLMKSGKTVLFAFEEAIGIFELIVILSVNYKQFIMLWCNFHLFHLLWMLLDCDK